jgi:hypothetical protein
MGNTSERAAATFAKLPESFRAGAQYFEAMDCAIYLKVDCSYRAARVSQSLSLLLAPYADDVVGVKIKGVRHLAERLFGVMEQAGHPLDEANRIELRSLLQIAFLSDEVAGKALSDAEAARRQQLAERARKFLDAAGDFSIQLPPIALAA